MVTERCDFKCLGCAVKPCYHDDPQIGDEYEVTYPEFFWWKLDHLPEKKRPTLLTPVSMDEFFKEPDPKGTVYRFW